MNAMEKTSILLAGDGFDSFGDLRNALTAEGYEVLIADDNGESIHLAAASYADLIILNLNHAHTNGKGAKICMEFRMRTKCPIIVLSEDYDDEDWIKLLNECADNYIVKPFSNEWLLAVVRTSLRLWLDYKHNRKIPNHDIDRYKLTINHDTREVRVQNRKVDLTRTEFDILYYLAKNDGRVISHEEMINVVWGDKGSKAGQLRSLIYQIRQKIEDDPKKPEFIITVPGFGYRLNSKEPVNIK
jgi:two-component system KDP operon response regulator KdpE